MRRPSFCTVAAIVTLAVPRPRPSPHAAASTGGFR